MSPSKKKKNLLQSIEKFVAITAVMTLVLLGVAENQIHTAEDTVTKTLLNKLDFREVGNLNEEIEDVLFAEEKIEYDSIRGIYLTAHTVAANHLDAVIDALIASGGNAVVMDAEISGGKLAFTPKNEYLKGINPGTGLLDDYPEIIRKLKKRGIYTIARQVIFNDPYTASRKPEWRIHYSGGGLYDGRWMDPSHPEAQAYNILITKELIDLGFDEIQYDYIRFPDSYHYGLDYYYDETQQERWEIINNFMRTAHNVTQEADVKLSMDVFGATIWGNIDWTLVGQYIPELAKNVDVIYPMTYPSHVSPGYYGYANPYGDPYSFIEGSIRKFEEAADGHAEIRTWVQGFPLKIPNFGPWFVEEQVRGTYDAGARGFIVWSPGNKYLNSWSSLGMLPPKLPEEEIIDEAQAEGQELEN